MVVVNGQNGGAKTPLRDLIDGALKRMEAGATMELGCIPNDSSRSWSILGDHVTKEIARLVKLGMKLDQHVPHMTNDDIRLLIVETTTKALMNHRMVSDEVFNALRLKNLLAMTPDDRQDGWAAMQMISEAIEELFGPKASLESEEATLLRGPEFHHRAEAIVEALQRVAGSKKDTADPNKKDTAGPNKRRAFQDILVGLLRKRATTIPAIRAHLALYGVSRSSEVHPRDHRRFITGLMQ